MSFDRRSGPTSTPTDVVAAAPIDDAHSFALRLEALARMSAALTGLSDEAQLYEVASRYMCDLIPVERASVALLNPDGSTLRLRTLHGSEGAAGDGEVIAGSGRVVGQVCKDGALLYIPDISDSALIDLEVLHRQGFRSVALVPLVAGDTRIGSFNLARKTTRGFTPDEIRLLDHAGRFLAMAITSVRRLEATARAERSSTLARQVATERVCEIECLNQVFRILGEDVPLERRLDLAARELATLQGIDNCELALIDDDGVLRPIDQTGHLGLGWVTTGDLPEAVDPLMSSRYDISLRPALGGGIGTSGSTDRSFYELAVPINVRNRPAGRLVLVSIEPHLFGPSKAALADTVAVKIGNALERDLMVAELRRAAETAEAASRARARFLANMSHELRTPINGVIGMTELLKDTELTSQQRMYVETICTSGKAQVAVINHILDFSKADANKLELQPAPFCLESCIEEAMDLAAATLGSKRVDLSYEVDPNLPAMLVGDVNRIRQILINLLSNAVKCTERGQIVVTADDLGPDPATDAGGNQGSGSERRRRLRISVHDTGPGIPPDRIQWLFEPFTQLDNNPSGSGLGLAISKQLVELMGGSIEVASTEGVGSAFHLHLTLPPDGAGGANDDLWRPRPGLSGRSVLLVGPPTTSIDVVWRAVRRWGMAVSRTGTLPPELIEGTGQSRSVVGADHLGSTGPGPAGFNGVDVVIIDGRCWSGPGGEQPAMTSDPPLPVILLETAADRLHLPSGGSRIAALKRPARPAKLLATLTRLLTTDTDTDTDTGAVATPSALGYRHPLRLLVAEDNVVNQMVTLALLQRLGYAADLAVDGRAAIDAAVRAADAGAGYDLVFMDLKMPHTNGIEATREILRRCQPRPPRIVALTADTIAVVGDACRNAGMDGFLVKPIEPDALIEVLTSTRGAYGLTTDPARIPASPQGDPHPEDAGIDDGALAVLLDVVGNRPHVVAEILRAFCDDTPSLVDAVARAATGNDPRLAAEAAHPLKSMSATVGAHRLAVEAAAIERRARADQVPDPEQVAVLETLAASAVADLRSRLDRGL